MPKLRLRLGTRSSALARWQANWVAAQLVSAGVEVELVPITTRGDASHRDTIADIGSPGVFTKELQRALLDEQIDLAVHSLKDLPTDAVMGLLLAAIPERADARDVLVSGNGEPLVSLPRGARIGTGSVRRRAQLLHHRPDLRMADIRGNVDTRLQKLANGDYDALVLAYAGLARLELQDQVSEIFEPAVLLPAVGQGALGIEVREDDTATRTAIAPLNHHATHQAVHAERALLAALGGGCLAPVGGWARVIADGRLQLDAVVLSADGKTRLAASGVAHLDAPLPLGAEVAGRLINDGASVLVDQARSEI